MLRFLALLPLLAACAAPIAQTPAAPSASDLERAQGYALTDDGATFLFDASLYGLAPERVVVTGAFRGWSADMDDAAWALAPSGDGLWTLHVDDPAGVGLGPSVPFKFRVDAGRWLDPHPGAPNVEGGNLVFLQGVTPTRLVAELRGPQSVWVELSGDGLARPTSEAAYRIVRWDGAEYRVADAIPHEAHSALLVPAGPLDTKQVHYVEVDLPGEERPVRAMARFDGLWRDLADAGPLGATLEPRPLHLTTTGPDGEEVRAYLEPGDDTVFRLFAPRADSVHVHLYSTRTGPETARHALAPAASGTWEVRIGEDLHGTWYDYSVYGPDGPGSHFTNQTGSRVSDPYALVSDDSWGRSRVWRDDFEAPAPVRGGRPAMEDVIAYEVHLQDFTDRLPLAEGVGAIEAFATPGLTNDRGEPIGLDYLERLGINTVHLMPVQEYLHYPDDAWQAAFADDPFMQEQGIAMENYQWGYRTTHAFAVESRFRSAGDEPGRERERFRDLVDALHQRGMAVLIDVVFNHTGEDMEGQLQTLTFNGIDKHYYYRLDERGNHIGAFGNEVKSENRPMTQRWLLDQLRHWVDTFGVDGFRIDLAGQTDEQTLRWIQAELGEDVLIYGEPWIGSNDPDYEANPDWDWYKADSPITFFQDDARNAFKGSPGEDPTPAPASRGFAGGDPEAREDAMRGIANDYPEEPTPNAGINYLDIHDNWALADRFASCQTGDCAWDGREGVREAEMRIAAALLLTSLGPVVLHGGTEIAKSKGLAPLPAEIDGEWERTEMGVSPIYLKGRGDTYNLRAANQYDWSHVGWADGPVDYAAMHDWWQGLIALRRSEAGEVFRVGTEVPEGHVQFFAPEDAPQALGWLVGDRVLTLVNTGDAPVRMQLDYRVPDGDWRKVAASDNAGGTVNLEGQVPESVAIIGGALNASRLEPKSVQIWVRD
ncbi:MAG TPA: pullulanase [Bacteroidetes bacterium]|nr:pullulanase [Bacteroidota bacterium]HIL57846.1 pullulanase [Rhodothermales bacterium]